MEKTDLELACEPLIKYLNDTQHPHVTVVVTPTSYELLEAIESNPSVFEHLND